MTSTAKLVLVQAMAAVSMACTSPGPTLQLHVAAASDVGPLDAVRVQAMVPGGPASQPFEMQLDGRDLATAPLVVEVRLGDSAFATAASLAVLGLANGRPHAAWYGTADLGAVRELQATLVLIPRSPKDCDADHDGFKACAADGSCCKEGEQQFADCDDSSAVFKPFAQDQACRDCQHLQQCWTAQVEAESGTEIVAEAGFETIDWPEFGAEETVDEGTQVEAGEAYVPAGQGRLEFVDQFGDDQKTCIQADICVFNVSFNSERSLKVRYTEDGVPQEGVPLTFQVIEDPDAAGKLAASTVYTLASGVAEGKVKVVKATDTYFKVKVFLQGADVAPIYFKIHAQPKIDSALTVSFSYSGTQAFAGVKVYLYQSESNQVASTTCAGIDPRALPTADLEKGPMDLSQTAKFAANVFPGLADEGEQFYTVVARGEQGTGQPVAYGCDDATAHVTVIASHHVSVTLKDIAPSIQGSYDIQTQLDLVSALPDNVQIIVNFILDFFEKPSASLAQLSCVLANSTLEDFCGWVFNDPNNPSIYDLTTLGSVVLEIMDAFLSAAVEQWTGTEIIGIGDDIRDMIKELTLIATFTISAEPDEFGYIPPEKTSASWHTVSVRWTWGQNCSPGAENCGRINLSLQSLGQDIAVAHFPATAMYNGQYTELTIGEHSISIKYGQLINHLLQLYVLSTVFGDGSDGLPVVDSFDALFKALLAGGRECLATGGAQPTCCELFVTQTLNMSGGVGADALETACETLVTLGSSYLEAQLTSLDQATGNSTILSTRDGQPCKLYDINADGKIDAWGKKEPVSERCIWDLQLKFSGGTADLDKNSFFGFEHQ
jgi:hypothetical protein